MNQGILNVLPAEAGGQKLSEEKLALEKDNLFFERVKGFFSGLKKLFKELWSGAKDVGNGGIKLFRSPPGEYITFIIFIILVIVGIAWLAFSDNSPLRRAGSGEGVGSTGGDGGGGIMGRVNRYLGNLNIDLSWLSKFKGTNGDTIITVPRVSTEGRCDGINNIDITNPTTKVCLNAKLPVTIEWNLDPTNIIDWRSLPTRVQEKLLKEKGGTKVYIPWGVMETPVNAANPFASLNRQANTLVPLCSKAYYTDGSSAAHLFKTDEETPDHCKRAIYNNTKYTSRRTDIYEDTRPTTRTPVNRGENKTCTL